MPKRPGDNGPIDTKRRRRRRRMTSSSSSSSSTDEDDYCEDDSSSDSEKSTEFVDAVAHRLRTRLTYKEKKFLNLANKRIRGSVESDLKTFRSYDKNEQLKLIQSLERIKEVNEMDKSYLLKVLDSDIPEEVKAHIVRKIEQVETGHDHGKLTQYVESILKMPLGIVADPPIATNKSKATLKKFINDSKETMDKYVFGQELAKNKFLQIIAQGITNPKANCAVIGLVGPPGSAKTLLVQEAVSRVLKKPFVYIPLGGAGDVSYLQGFSYCWEGSHHGKIADVLMKSKVMNPVFYFDELDKISDGWRGGEIVNALIQLVDIEQNKKYEDRYFAGIDLDLSNATFIFSYNDSSKVNYVLKDRITEIKVKGYKTPEKVIIAEKYMLPKIYDDVGIKEGHIIYEKDLLEYIIDTYTNESGVRKFKEMLYEIVREINLRVVAGKHNYRFPLIITKRMITNDLLLKFHIITPERIHDTPTIGMINGLYTTSFGNGGILPIEVSEMPAKEKLDAEITGMLGKNMEESVKVAKSVAWNILPKVVKDRLNHQWKKHGPVGLHIHFPDATDKDGPSAGCCITVAIVSRLLGIPIRNDMGMTGECTLGGTSEIIGGLVNKLWGAKKAGIKRVLLPEDNKKDLRVIKSDYPDLIDDTFTVKAISHVSEALDEFLIDCPYDFSMSLC